MSESVVTPEVFTADYMGEPGKRTFYLQSRSEQGTLTYLIEKQQVAVLAEKLRELMMLIDQSDPVLSTPPARDPALVITEPLEPEWRIGTIGLAYEEDSDQVVVLVRPVEGDDLDDLEDDQDDDAFSVRFLLKRHQTRAFVLHALAIVAEGRPLCQLCGLPMDPSGHNCPASNGHRPDA